MKDIQLLLFVFLFQTGYSQLIECEYDFTQQYEVTAESGLRFRAGPSLESTTLGLIPHGSVILICSEDAQNKKETIDGFQGRWIKAYWKEQAGFVFDAYIRPVEEELEIMAINLNMDVPVDWKSANFPEFKTYAGLYPSEENGVFVLKELPMKASELESYLHVDSEGPRPIWIFSGLEIDGSREIEGKFINDMLYVGEKERFDGGILYAEGKPVRGEPPYHGAFKEINPYELRLQTWEEGGPIEDHLLVKMVCKSGISQTYGYDAKPSIRFIGDLDGDGKQDILITYQLTYKGWRHGLFSTRYAEQGAPFRLLTVGGGSTP